MAHVLALRHMYSNSLFTCEDVFRAHGHTVRTVEGYDPEFPKLDPLAPDILVILGGAMGVYEQDNYPYLTDEIAFIKTRVMADRPTLGICLGAQLMAAALGEKVYKGQQGPEIGFFDITLTAECQNSPIRHFSSDRTKVLQLHGDTFDLPSSAILLASSPLYRNQAFRIGKNCLAVQFHPEFHEAAYANLLVEDNGKIDVKDFRRDGEKYLGPMITQTRLFLDDLLAVWGIQAP